MDRIRITKIFNFEMAHALHGYTGKCAQIHGHSYRLTVTVLGTLIQDDYNSNQGMVMDFSDLKKLVNEEIIEVFDHALVLKATDPLFKVLETHDHENRQIVKTSYQPTCENMLIDFACRLRKRISAPLILHSMMLQETPTSYASWFADDNK